MKNGESIPSKVARGVAGLPDRIHAKLAAVGLVEPRVKAERATLGQMLRAFVDAADVKPASRVRMEQARTALVRHFTEARDVATISEKDADGWRTMLKAEGRRGRKPKDNETLKPKADKSKDEKPKGFAAATISRTVLYARQMFRWGMKRAWSLPTLSRS